MPALTAGTLLFSLGYFVDTSEKPVPSDLIVSLGGGDGERIKEAVRLWKEGYSATGKLLYTGRDIVNPALKPPLRFSKEAFLEANGIDRRHRIYVPRGVIVNTAEELFFIKAYILQHGYRSVLVVSSPTHTRRIKTLAKWIARYDDANIALHVTSYPDPKWHPATWFLDKERRNEVFLEIEKLIYNLLKYSPLTIEKTSYAKKQDMWQAFLRQLP